ncbi:MAG TPA: IgGFc-binding protein [Burkholderiaceae bacterium]
MNQAFTIGASGVLDIDVPESQFLDPGNTVLNKALRVTSASPISGYFLNRYPASSDMTYLLDIPALGTEYRVLGWQQSIIGALQVSLTAVQNGTVATITPASALASGQPAGVPFNVTLNAGESVIYNAPSGNDLTGSLITATKPLAVFSGSQCADIPETAGACDHIFTQLPPVNRLASEFVVPETADTGTAGNLVRIVAATANTVVTVNGTVVATLATGAFYEIPAAHNLHITTSQPVLVGQFLKGFSETGHGDPAITFVPGINQTLSNYVFTTPTTSATSTAFDENFLSLAVPASALASLKLNGAAVDTSAFVPVGSSGYSAGTVAVPVGAGQIQASVPFIATLAGFTAYDSYLTIIGASYSAGASPSPVTALPVPMNGPWTLLLAALGMVGIAGWQMRRLHDRA